MQHCNTCLFSDAYPSISFDPNSTCNYCRFFTDYVYMGEKALNDLITKIKSKELDYNLNYNCLISLSGGRDSSYLALRAIKDWNLRPLAYCYDNGHMPEVTHENVKRVSKKLDIRTIVVNSEAERNRDLFRRIFNAWIRHPHLGMIQTFCIGCKGGVNKFIPQLLNNYNISYILDGSNYYECGSYKLRFFEVNSMDSDLFLGGYKKAHLQLAWAILREFLKNPRYITPSIVYYGANDFLKGFGANIDKIRPFFYEKYNASKIMNAIKDELDWQQPGYFPDPWRSDCDVALIKNYLCFKMKGFSDYDVFLSNMIRDNAIDRNAAEERLQQINHILNNSDSKIKELLKTYRISTESIQLLFNLLED